MDKPVVQVEFTNGVGNNLFQYIYARLFAERIDGRVSVRYVNGSEYARDFFVQQGIQLETLGYPNRIHHILRGYFEDYTQYVNHVDRIRSWFAPVEKSNVDDLVVHLRLGNKLFLDEIYTSNMIIEFSQWITAIERFDFDKLHIVTDMKFWEYQTVESLKDAKFHLVTSVEADYQRAADYFNRIYKALSIYNPVVRAGQDIAGDFDYIRSFDNILFQTGTLAWWAAVLSYASKVGVYGPWRPCKGSNNKNLSKIPLPGWFQWE